MDGLSSSCASVLLLGEGNFSFARSLNQKLGGGVRVVATSFEEEEGVGKRKNGRENVDALREKDVTCLFGVDATRIHASQSLEGQSFDGIIFNFPHVPGKANIAKNRELLKGFFQSCVQKLSPAGQVLVTLCNGQGGTPADQPQREKQNSWQVVDMATYGDLILTDTLPFRAGEYQEYNSTGYRNQDKGFLTDRAVTHVFERSRLILEVVEAPTLSAKLDGNTLEFQCPPDIGACMKRDLLSEPSHPLSIFKMSLVSAFQSLYPKMTVLQECDFASVVPETIKNGCEGVYRLLNIHEPGDSSGAWLLRPHLLCHVKSLIGRHANEGCVLLGKSYHRCAVAPDSFPIMHHLLLAVPCGQNTVDSVAKVLADLHCCVHIQSKGTDHETNESLENAGNMESAKSFKRSHSRMEETGAQPSSGEGENEKKFEHCRVCLRDWVKTYEAIQLKDSSGNWATVGLCGTATREATNYDIVVLYLDQLVMHLLNVTDIRMLWSTDVTMQDKRSKKPATVGFGNKESVNFGDFELIGRSRYPPLYVRDVSFWVQGGFDELRFVSLLLRATGLLLQRVWLKEVYHDQTRGDASRCYRLEYRSCDRALSKDRLARIHQGVLELLREEMGLVAR
ncbi:ferredoxin-fold anticodon-binding domain-containing protein 1-like [Patiria miniata]|uniref:FDX-ACB domain-containing protein n=1 Tax=Patiria miniata TaxID=46514 RepID=A0A914AQK1_PATMI|nr:ferredoxin-fold anticodon-binding domain-containing protein 1-like [Patiria miniata]